MCDTVLGTLVQILFSQRLSTKAKFEIIQEIREMKQKSECENKSQMDNIYLYN